MTTFGSNGSPWLTRVLAIWLLGGGAITLSGATQLEFNGLSIEGEDTLGVFAVRDLAVVAEQAWEPLLGPPATVLPPAILRLEDPAGLLPGSTARVRGLRAWLPWQAATSRHSVEMMLAELHLTRRRLAAGAERAWAPWVRDAMVHALRVEAHPLRVDHLGPVRPARPLGEVLVEQTEASELLSIERWVLARALGRIWPAERQAVERLWQGDGSDGSLEGLPVEVWWARHWAHQQSLPFGPFLSLEESASRLRGLGQVDVRQRGIESRVWWYALPAVERARGSALRDARRLHLGLLLPRVHPVYHGAAVALAGSLEADAEAAVMGARFPALWAEAETLAEEIRALLEE